MACEACQTIPPVVVEGYEEKGAWETVRGLKTYVTGSKDAKKALVAVYDIFGAASQTLQGADSLAKVLGVLVVVPDLLNGTYAEEEWFTKPSEENKAASGAYFAVAMDFPTQTKGFLAFTAEAKKKFGSVERWGTYGLCWGGKVSKLASGKDTPFTSSGQVHPAGLSVADAQALSIPHILLASNGEPQDVVKEYAELLVEEGKPNVVERYGTMHHGWMGAGAKLHEEENLKEYERGYNQLGEFFWEAPLSRERGKRRVWVFD